jgi:hypothetical protein
LTHRHESLSRLDSRHENATASPPGRRRPAGESPLFWSTFGPRRQGLVKRPMEGNSVWRPCKTYGRLIGYPMPKPHDPRHGVAMEVPEQQHDPEQMRALLGHARIDTPQIHTSTRPSQLKRAVGFHEKEAARRFFLPGVPSLRVTPPPRLDPRPHEHPRARDDHQGQREKRRVHDGMGRVGVAGEGEVRRRRDGEQEQHGQDAVHTPPAVHFRPPLS